MIALLAMVVDPENKSTTPINPNQPPINHQSMSEKKEIQGTPTTFPNINNHHHHHLPAITTLAVRSKAVLPNTLFTTMLLTGERVEKVVEKRVGRVKLCSAKDSQHQCLTCTSGIQRDVQCTRGVRDWERRKKVRLWGTTSVSVCCHVPVDTMAMDKMALASNVKAPPPLPKTK